MNYNLYGYVLFFSIMFYVIGIVGWRFYILGRPFIVKQLENDKHLVDPINKLLLLGYYLLNLGYVILSINKWQTLNSVSDIITMVATKSGTIILMLGVIHYFNMFWLSQFNSILNKTRINSLNNNKK